MGVLIFSSSNTAVKTWDDLGYFSIAICSLGLICFIINYLLPDSLGDRPKKSMPKTVSFADPEVSKTHNLESNRDMWKQIKNINKLN